MENRALGGPPTECLVYLDLVSSASSKWAVAYRFIFSIGATMIPLKFSI